MRGNATPVFLVMAEVYHAAIDNTVLQPVESWDDKEAADRSAQHIANVDRIPTYVIAVDRFTPSNDVMPWGNR